MVPIKKYTFMLVLFCAFIAISALGKRWPKTADGTQAIVCYVIDKASGYNATHLTLIQDTMYELQNKTCIRFRRRTDQKNFIRIYSGDGCGSKIGVMGGSQDVSLSIQDGCLQRKKIIHEFIHAIGFNHMHQRFDRGDYVTIQWGNIYSTDWPFFKLLQNQDEAFNTTYDYLSCMHYIYYAWSKTGGRTQITIVTKDPAYQYQIGNVTTLSVGDAQRINRMYTCPKNGIYS